MNCRGGRAQAVVIEGYAEIIFSRKNARRMGCQTRTILDLK